MATLRSDWCPGIIDLSDNQVQKTIDWKMCLADGIIAVIHKATEGTERKDPFYMPRRTEAKNAGMLWGPITTAAETRMGHIRRTFSLMRRNQEPMS